MTLRYSLRRLFSPVRPILVISLLAAAGFILAGCNQTGSLRDQAYYRPLAASEFFPDGRSARPFQPGTVPYMAGDASPNDPVLTGLDAQGQPVQGFPVPVDQALIALGQEQFDIYCIPCHGPAGEANGRAVQFGFPKPPSLLETDKTNSEMFDVITNGQDVMFPYGYKVKPNERWAIISYIRALQIRGAVVNAQDLSPEEINQIGKKP